MSSSAADASCQERYQDEVDRFETLLYTSLALTFINAAISLALIALASFSRIKLAYYLWGTGSVKILLAIALLATIPDCPSGCVCKGGHINPAVAAIPLLVGLSWLSKGLTFYRIGKAAAQGYEQPSGEVDDPMTTTATRMPEVAIGKNMV